MKANTAQTKKQKGTRLEHKFASMLRESGLDKNAKRTPLSGAMFGFETDIWTDLPFAFELKNQETVKLWEWWTQAERGRRPFKDPVLVTSGNFRPMLVIMKAEDWINLLLIAFPEKNPANKKVVKTQ